MNNLSLGECCAKKPLRQSDKLAIANQPDITVVDKQQKKAPVIVVAIPSDSKKEGLRKDENIPRADGGDR